MHHVIVDPNQSQFIVNQNVSVIKFTKAPLNQTTQLEHRHIYEDYESAILDKEHTLTQKTA